jgi:serine/threonine-protein kinase
MRRALQLAGVVALAFVSGIALVQVGMMMFVRSGAETQVPEVLGLEVAQARAVLERAGFAGVQEREMNSAEYAQGQVAEQRPAAGKLLRKGRKVWLTVSLGEVRASVPDLSGLSVRQAGIALQKEKLESGTVSRAPHHRVPRGEVIAQNPPQGASLSEGERVNLLVSLGPEPRAWVLPDLAGRPLREVEALLGRYGIRLGERTYLLDRSVLPGTVLRHDPPPGSRVASGQRIDVEVSSRY